MPLNRLTKADYLCPCSEAWSVSQTEEDSSVCWKLFPWLPVSCQKEVLPYSLWPCMQWTEEEKLKDDWLFVTHAGGDLFSSVLYSHGVFPVCGHQINRCKTYTFCLSHIKRKLWGSLSRFSPEDQQNDPKTCFHLWFLKKKYKFKCQSPLYFDLVDTSLSF